MVPAGAVERAAVGGGRGLVASTKKVFCFGFIESNQSPFVVSQCILKPN